MAIDNRSSIWAPPKEPSHAEPGATEIRDPGRLRWPRCCELGPRFARRASHSR